jgi:putative peptidoglycan lipid II flippase
MRLAMADAVESTAAGGVAAEGKLAAAGGDRFVKHANLMSGLTIVSRVAGLLRDKLWSTYLAAGQEFSAFWMGFQFPNLFRRIFGEGALTAIFVPVYTRVQKEKGQEAANRLASVTATLLVLTLGAVTLVGEAVLIPVALSGGVQANNRLAAAMLAIMLPYCVMVCLVALFGAIASVHEKFTAQSISPIILNLMAALGAMLPVLWFTRDYPVGKRVYWVAGAVLVAGVLQIVQMLPTLRKSGVRLSALLDIKGSGVWDVITPLVPMIVGLSAVQLNTFMDGQIAYWLSPDGHGKRTAVAFFGHMVNLPMGEGALAKLSAAQRLYMLPVGIFGVSMATAIFPMLSRAAAGNDIAEVKRLLVAGLRKTMFLSVPASLGMILVAHLLLELIYSGPKVTPADIDREAWAAIWFCAGIWCFEAQMVILRVFYALRDTITPMKVAVGMVVLNFSLNITLVWWMREGGLALSTSISALVQCVILLWILRGRLGALGIRAMGKTVGMSVLAALVMVEVGLIVRGIRLPWEGHRDLYSRMMTAVVKLPLVVGASAGVYFGVAWFLGMGELKDLPVAGRFFRRVMKG